MYDEDGECKSGQLAFYLEKNYGISKSTCYTLMDSLKQQYLDPLIKHLTPETDFKTIEAAFVNLVSKYRQKCVGPASDEVLDAFIKVIIIQYSLSKFRHASTTLYCVHQN